MANDLLSIRLLIYKNSQTHEDINFMKNMIKYFIVIVSMHIISYNTKASQLSEYVTENTQSEINYDSSEMNRKYKTFMFNTQLNGIEHNFTFTQGLIASYYLNSDSLIQLEYTTSNYDTNYIDTTHSSFNAFGIHYKKFISNSFYFNTGVDQRYIKYKIDKSSYYYEKNYNLEGNTFTADFIIGNQWQWSNFTLGCDWVGVVAPIKSSYSGTLTGEITKLDFEEYNSDKNRFFKDPSLIVTRFYLGASF